MAVYEHKPNPPTWEEFEKRCRDNIDRIKKANDIGLYSNMYVNDVSLLLEVVRRMQGFVDIRMREHENAKEFSYRLARPD